jgi:hypothetical protein
MLEVFSPEGIRSCPRSAHYWYLPGLEPEEIRATVAMAEDARIPDTEAL